MYLSEEQERVKGEGLVLVVADLHDAHPLPQGVVLEASQRPQLLVLGGLEGNAEGRHSISVPPVERTKTKTLGQTPHHGQLSSQESRARCVSSAKVRRVSFKER